MSILRLRQIEHAVITEQKRPPGLFRAVLRGRLLLVANVPEDDGARFLTVANLSTQLRCLIESKPESWGKPLRRERKNIEAGIIFSRD